ncbi:MAG: reverse transcriptase domain-containing protein, partial [Clostridiaceae bacterium]
PTHHNYKGNSDKYRAIKKSNLKEIFTVRYADDFKLFCKNRATADKIFYATKHWLKERLSLEISEEKSKVINLKKRYSEFLGMKMKLWKKGSKQVIKSEMTDKAIKKCKIKLKEKVKGMTKNPTGENVNKYNATVLGLHNYYKVSTNVNPNFKEIAFKVNKSLKCRSKNIKSKKGRKSKAYLMYYGDYGGKEIYIADMVLFPITYIQNKPPMCFSQDICNYTIEGRNKIHDKLQAIDNKILQYLMNNPIQGQSIEYNDNRISLYVGQRGICGLTKEKLRISDMEVHHKVPREVGGTDEYDNLIYIKSDIHKLIHATNPQTIQKYLTNFAKVNIDFKRLNKFRNLVGNCEIIVNK